MVKKLREPLGGRGVGHDSWDLGKSGSVEFVMGQGTFHPKATNLNLVQVNSEAALVAVGRYKRSCWSPSSS